MSKVVSEQKLDVPAEKVWELIGSFNALADWHPAVESCELSDGGNIRTLRIAGGGEVIERLEKVEAGEFEYSYSIVDSPFPVSEYTSTIRIREADGGNGCIVEWGSQFNPSGVSASEAEAVMRGVYKAGFDNLKKMFSL